MAMKPVKGNFPHGFSLRQGDVNLSKASGSMWINPVAKITPAANALIMKKISCSGLRVGTLLPSNGMLTPTAPVKRMVTIEAILYLSASPLFFSVVSPSHVHSPDTIEGAGERSSRRNKSLKMLKEEARRLIMACDRERERELEKDVGILEIG
jgi:hypothetical protein